MDKLRLGPLGYHDRHTLIQDRLKEFILQNELKPGDKLPTEETLSRELGVSRTAVREALRGLEALGIVESQQGAGRVVRPFSFDPVLNALSYGLMFEDYSVLQVTEIRKALDAFFIEPAIGRLTARDLAQLESIVERMQEKTAAGESMDAEDHAFHEILYRACGNPLALQLFEITWRVRAAALDQSAALKEMPPGTVGEHRQILEAIKAQDVGRARELIIGHHWNIEQRFRRAIEDRLLSPGAYGDVRELTGGDAHELGAAEHWDKNASG